MVISINNPKVAFKEKLVNCVFPQVFGYGRFCMKEKYGELTKSLVTDTPANLNSKVYNHYLKTIPHFDSEAVYVYSFKEKRMLFAKGWESLLGYKDDEISMLKIVSITTPRYQNFANELNDKALQFIATKTEDLEQYSFTLEVEKIHKNGSHIPLFSRIGVLKSHQGRIQEIMGTSHVVKSLHFGKVMQYAAYGPDKSGFEETLSKELFSHHVISRKEKEALKFASEGFAFKEIANKLGISQSAVEKRIIPLYKRFHVRSLPHLISFAYENHIL